MATATLSATARSEAGKGVARKLRAAGQVPAVIYGHNREPASLALNARELDRLLEHIAAGSTVIELAVDGTRPARTLIREIQRHPVKRNILHVDFQELVAGETVVIRCPIVYVGTAEGVRGQGGILDQVLHELEIEVDPANIPNHIDVDITNLTIGHPLHVADLQLPAGVKVLDDPESTVVLVSAPKVSAEDAAAEAAAASAEPEVVKKGKTEDDK